MKIFTLATLICFWPWLNILADNNGRINRIKSGVYQLSYPEQSMHLFFNYIPSNGLQNMFAEIELSDNQQYEIVFILKQFIDQLPQEFITRFLDIEIFLLRIQNETDYGYTLDDQVVVEISKMRRGSSFANSIQTSFAHELAHLVEKDQDTKSGAAAMKNYLKNIRSTYYSENNRSTSIYDQGYVSRYASGELGKGYNPNEEFAEIFAHLLCRESRANLFRYLEREGGSVLNVKMDRYLKFLEYNLPYLGENYLTNNVEVEVPVPLNSYESLDGDLLLLSHEQKSYEAMSYDMMEEEEDDYPTIRNDDTFKRNNAMLKSTDSPFKRNDATSYKDFSLPDKNETPSYNDFSIPDRSDATANNDFNPPERNDAVIRSESSSNYEDDRFAGLQEELARLEAKIDRPREDNQEEYTVYKYSPSTDNFSQDEPPQESSKKEKRSNKKKYKKKKKGASWLLIGTAIYVALQLMK